jgi:hypothetical protein
MSDPMKQAWSEVAEGFAKLGQAMKTASGLGPDRPDGGAPEGDSAADPGLRDAFERLVAAGRDVGQRAADAVRDADINTEAKHAASALNDALAATVDMIGREVSGWFGRPEHTDDAPVVTTAHDAPVDAQPTTTEPVATTPDDREGLAP